VKRFLLFVGVLGFGAIAGWYGHVLYSFFSPKPVAVLKDIDIAMPQSTLTTENLPPLTTPDFFSPSDLLDNTQLGILIELIKQDLDVEAKNRLNNDVIKYANFLRVNAARDKNTEQRLLALLGNYDTKEVVLDILVQFYVKKKQYKKAISSLFNLRAMTQFDDEYDKISQRIKTLSRQNLKQLKAHNEKAKMADFYEYMLAKEPDNFSMQMQYAQFEYENRKYSHVEELLEVLLYHPDFAVKAEALLQKTLHQKEMIENGIVPVPVTKSGNHFIVNAVINNQERAKLIIDTGATLTVLSPKIIQALGLRLDEAAQYREFATANGVVTAPVVTLDSFRIQNYLVNNLQVGVLAGFSNEAFGGLLGMNFLNQFAFFIDQKNNTLELVEIE